MAISSLNLIPTMYIRTTNIGCSEIEKICWIKLAPPDKRYQFSITALVLGDDNTAERNASLGRQAYIYI